MEKSNEIKLIACDFEAKANIFYYFVKEKWLIQHLFIIIEWASIVSLFILGSIILFIEIIHSNHELLSQFFSFRSQVVSALEPV